MRRIVVRLHARAAELAGGRECGIELGENARVADLKAALAGRVPALAGLLPSCALASETEFLHDEATLGELDLIHVLPPVSGG